MPKYDPAKIEKKWQKKWAASKVYQSKEDPNKKKYYVLDMFPYPSSEGLHVGHPKGYIATDIISRFKRMHGYSVLHPMGFDAFGLPAENYALKMKTHPSEAVKNNVARYKKQLDLIGMDYDWSREVNTTDPAYYKWTQWIFLQLFKKGLAFESYEPINWCPVDKTGLANEDVIDGRCERCGALVEKRPMRQWVLRITDYAERLLADLDATTGATAGLSDDTTVDMSSSVPLFTQIKEPGAVREHLPFVERNAITAIVKHWSEDKYIGLKWKKVPWQTFITGGIEKGQTAEQAALSEIQEETGYIHAKLIKNLGKVDSKFFHIPKNENRFAHFDVLYFELQDGEKLPISEKEQANHEVVWLSREEMSGFITPLAQKYMWSSLLWGDTFEAVPEKVPLFVRTQGEDALKDGLPLEERQAVICIIKHWSENKYLCSKYKKNTWQGFIIGGLEKGENLETAAVREVQEESGYQNIRFVKTVGKVDSQFYHSVKKVNRFGHFTCVHLELKDGVRNEMAEHEKELHDVEWIPEHDVRSFLNREELVYLWDLHMGVKKLETSKPLLDWPESIKELQRNWIGKSEGASITFKVKGGKGAGGASDAGARDIEVFTTRPDTIFGVTYVVLAPEHDLVREFLPAVENRVEAEAYISKTKRETEIQRTDATKEKTGVELKGIRAVNPATKEEVPVWIADYVLADYGTGAVMAVPAHDERDWEFAKKYEFPVKYVVVPERKGFPGELAFRENEPVVNRKVMRAFVKHWSEDKYALLNWKDNRWKTFISGGIEEGEDPVLAAKREIQEEIGYKNAEFIGIIGGPVRAKFYAPNKKQNRIDIQYGLLFKLKDAKKSEISADEQKIHDMEWVPFDSVKKFVGGTIMDSFLFERILSGDTKSFIGDGYLIDSSHFSGKESSSVKKEITKAVGGKWVTTYKLRDWVFSRQRYWGEPIPLIHCERHGVVAVPEDQLPVALPKVKSYEPTGTGESPLASIEKWVNTTCPTCLAEKKKMKYFIFDFDGVLGDTWKAALESHIGVGDIKTPEQALERISAYFSKKPHHSRDSVRSAEQIVLDNEFNTMFGQKMAQSEFPLFTKFIQEIKKYKNTTFAVVSSGSEQYVKPALKKVGMKFTHILSFEDHHSKEEKIETICKDWGVDLKDIYYFTDTKADVYELETILDKTQIVGCSWGYNGYDGLREVLPEKNILKDFTDIHRFFNPECKAKRETNTMPQWAGSCWYYLSYEDPKNDKALVDPAKEKYWSPVDLYVGGAEHATRHLIYARFWHKFLYDIGTVSTSEPFTKLQAVGLIMGEDGRKMSKRFGNVVNPDDIVKIYGADTLRMYEMFMGPFDQQIAWSTSSMAGTRRFIERVWKLQEKVTSESSTDVTKILHKTIKKVTADIEGLRFNTAISALMIAVNECEKIESLTREQYKIFLQLLAPFAPHATEELWSMTGEKKSIHISKWPEYDAALAHDDEVTIVVQVNGKMRGSFTSPNGAAKEDLENTAKNMPEIQKWLEGKPICKIIVVPGRLVNIVV